MKKTAVILISLITFTLLFISCSKKGSDKLAGKWKQERVQGMGENGPTIDVLYEFTKENKMLVDVMINYKIDGRDTVTNQPQINLSYTFSRNDDAIVELEAGNSEPGNSKLKFIIIFYSEKEIIIIDPGNKAAKLIKI